MDHDLVCSAINELPFPVGKKLLIDILRGEQTETTKRHRLDKLECFGSMAYEERELEYLLKDCIQKGVIKQEPLKGTRWPVLQVTGKKVSITEPIYAQITEKDKELFSNFEFFLGEYNDEQKKAIISHAEKILCIAGAGSGKTTVLTQRIKFLHQFRGVPLKKILAITFTRKAKEEMQERLNMPVQIETFNSFCEKYLREYNDRIYKQPVSIISFQKKIKLVHQALQLQGKTYEQATTLYFSSQQQKNKTYDQLCTIFVNDCFTILDHFKNANTPLMDFSEEVTKDRDIAKMVYLVCTYVEQAMVEQGLRDFSDQLVDCMKLFADNPELIPQFDHILIDEYQDINAIQETLIQTMNSKNLFCVGDPRQSIFGWRGSRIQYVLDFHEKHPSAELIHLKKNYRSTQNIVQLMNKSIEHMQLPALQASTPQEGKIALMTFESEEEEHTHIVAMLKEEKETFVLARTNKLLSRISNILREEQIPHRMKTDEGDQHILGESKLTLATVHAIKGLEAKRVIVMGCNGLNFPCKTSDHPILDVLNFHNYDKEEEELRLFYVAISRAKEELIVTHTGALTHFVTNDMQKLMEIPYQKSSLASKLQAWRRDVSKREKRPPYFIMHDATLNAIAAEQPINLEDLQSIPGMGPLKIQKYGDQILDVVHGLG